MPIVWGVAPPRRLAKSWIRLLVVKAGQSVPVRLLGPSLGIMTHWCNGRSIACLGSEDCQVHGLSQEWKGFAPAATWVARGANTPAYWRETVLVISAGIAADVDACSRGSLLEISRPGKKHNGPMRMMLAAKQPTDDPPEPFDVRPYVIRAMQLDPILACKLRLLAAQ